MADDPRRPLRPTVVRVNLAAVAANYRLLREVARPSDVCAVVKANAYGHGVAPVARRLQAEGCSRFAVGTLDEALELREAGVVGETWLLQGACAEHVDRLRGACLTPVVSSLRRLAELGEAADRGGDPLEVHVKFDTGMGRLGLERTEVGELVELLRRHPGLALRGVATHFARAGESPASTRGQIAAFDTILATLASLGVAPGVVHAANSAACLTEPDARYACVRVGIALYGIAPEPGLDDVGALRPALSWTSEVEQLRAVPRGTPVSYGGTFVTARPSRLAIVPVGYADGYRRALGNVGQMLLRGRRVPVVGRVCMDLAVVDVTDVPEAREGDEVTLLGRQGGEVISAEQVARWLDTIPYEIVCGIGARVPRFHEDAP